MLAFTIFNVYLPKLLETRCLETFAKTSSLERSLWDVVILPSEGVRELWCISFLPIESGLFIDDENVTKLGAWLIERPGRGRRLSLAGNTLLTAMLCVGFVLAQNPIAVTASTVGISLSSSVRGLFLLACGSILSGLTTGYVGCVIWVRHGLDCYRLTKANILLSISSWTPEIFATKGKLSSITDLLLIYILHLYVLFVEPFLTLVN